MRRRFGVVHIVIDWCFHAPMPLLWPGNGYQIHDSPLCSITTGLALQYQSTPFPDPRHASLCKEDSYGSQFLRTHRGHRKSIVAIVLRSVTITGVTAIESPFNSTSISSDRGISAVDPARWTYGAPSRFRSVAPASGAETRMFCSSNPQVCDSRIRHSTFAKRSTCRTLFK